LSFSYFENEALFSIAILLRGFFVKQNGKWLLAAGCWLLAAGTVL
jgi:hypothetical protein